MPLTRRRSRAVNESKCRHLFVNCYTPHTAASLPCCPGQNHSGRGLIRNNTMEDNRKHVITRIFHGLFFITPMLLGIYGYWFKEGLPLQDAAFKTLNYYTLNNDDIPTNMFQEVARWMAPLMTVGTIALFFQNVRDIFFGILARIRGTTTAVYGREPEKQILLDQLGVLGIQGKDRFVKADRYIFCGDEAENLTLYSRFQERLKGRPVYAKSDHLIDLGAKDDLYLFNPWETAARLYWKKRCLYPEAKAKNFHLSICLIGFEDLGQRLLIYGLMDNIFHPDQMIEYHVFGDSAKFRHIYHGIRQISDPVTFHDEPWYECLEILGKADRIIVTDNTNSLNQILRAVPAVKVDYLTDQSSEMHMTNYKNQLNVFDYGEEVWKVDRIVRETLLMNAKRINMYYVHEYDDAHPAQTMENAEAAWKKLDTFTRYSNISSADYHDIQRAMLAEDQILPKELLEEKNSAYLEMLSCLEHERWCRYHYLNNWTFGSGKKDPLHRTHPLLLPNDRLPDSEKVKDLNNLKVMFHLLEQ